jgi:indole-3-glycerol phosphate synthase
MHSRLKEILAEKRKEVEILKKRGVSTGREKDIPPTRDFKGAISIPNWIGLIAEIKFASPSAGVIREETDPITIGRIYEGAGAAAISLLTDKVFFHGDLHYLPQLKRAVSLPILRKDFIIDEIQVRESFLWGADAVLLIVRILSRQQLMRLLDTCKELGLAALTEAHDRDEVQGAIECGADIIGINNRNLDTFEVDLNTTMELAPLVPDRRILVGESGIGDGTDIRKLDGMGINAVLVGSALMKSDDVAKKTREMVDAGKPKRRVQ